MSSKEMKKIINLLEGAQNESETIAVPKNNSFAVYKKSKNQWWDPKKGWSNDITVWKARSLPTLIGSTDLAYSIEIAELGDIVVVDIFTGHPARQFDEKIKKTWEGRSPNGPILP